MNKEIIVSICCATYNHQKYIRDAIEGFLMQKTTFPFEILIHDDASTDGTADIIREYEAKYPDIIKPIYQTENQYSKGINPYIAFVYPRAQGKYIALCEGDDYWIDPLKLQKQVDYMERNSRVSILASHYTIYDQEKETFINPPKIKYELNFDTLIKKRNKIATATVCFRREFANQYTEEIKPLEKEWFIGDYSLWLFLSQKGQVKILNNVTTVYRRLLKSASNNQSIEKQFNFYRKINCMIDFYIKRYGCQDNTKIQFEKYKYNLEINYAFNLKNKSIMKQEMIKKRNAGFNVGLKYHIKFFFLLFNMNYIFNSINFQRKKMRLGKNG